MQHIFGVGPDAAQNAEHRLHKKDDLSNHDRQNAPGLKMTNVVTLQLKPGLVGRASCQGKFNVFEGVAENQIAAGQIQNRIGSVLDLQQEFSKSLGALIGLAGHRIASTKVNDGGPGLGRLNRSFNNFLGRHRQVGRHRRRI